MLRLVTGGSCSGKSAFAEKLAIEEKKKHPAGTLYYVATMVPYDEECQERIRRHRRMRKDKDFVTRECHTDLSRLTAEKEDVFLIECLSNLLANEMYEKTGRLQEKSSAPFCVEEVIAAPVRRLAGQCAAVIVVTNEVFSEGIAFPQETALYLQLLGKSNCLLARAADSVTEVICGIPVEQKK